MVIKIHTPGFRFVINFKINQQIRLRLPLTLHLYFLSKYSQLGFFPSLPKFLRKNPEKYCFLGILEISNYFLRPSCNMKFKFIKLSFQVASVLFLEAAPGIGFSSAQTQQYNDDMVVSFFEYLKVRIKLKSKTLLRH